MGEQGTADCFYELCIDQECMKRWIFCDFFCSMALEWQGRWDSGLLEVVRSSICWNRQQVGLGALYTVARIPLPQFPDARFCVFSGAWGGSGAGGSAVSADCQMCL